MDEICRNKSTIFHVSSPDNYCNSGEFKNCFITPHLSLYGKMNFILLLLDWEEFDFRNDIFVLNSNITN